MQKRLRADKDQQMLIYASPQFIFANAKSALTRFQAGVGFADNIYAAFATHNAAVFAALFGRFQGAQNLHGYIPVVTWLAFEPFV